MTRTFSTRWIAALAVIPATLTAAHAEPSQFVVHNLVSDGAVTADFVDHNLVNPWGLAAGPNTPFWVSDNGTGLSTIYMGDGSIQSLVVTIPPPEAGNPSGAVFNGGSGFVVTSGESSGPSRFIFASEDGMITGWSPAVSLTSAFVLADRSSVGAEYKGVTMAQVNGEDFLYAANFAGGMVEMFDSNMNLVKSFTDPRVGRGYAPFNVQSVGPVLVVTFALRGPTGDDVAGIGHGFVDVFSTDGTLLRRIASHGQLNSPWGVALAPMSWGRRLGGSLLIGNFGDGMIHAYSLRGHDDGFHQTLRGIDGKPIVIDGLWALKFGLGGANNSGVIVNGMPDELFFTAGTNHEADGLFGKIVVAPDDDGDGDGD